MPDNQLHDAAEKGDLEEVKELIGQGYDVNEEHSEYGTYPLNLAAKQGHLNVVQYLLEECRANHNKKGNLLHWGIECPDPEKRDLILQYLLEKKLKFEDGTTEAHIAAALGDVAFFKSNRRKLGVCNKFGVTPIYYAILANQGEIIKLNHQKNRKRYPPISMSPKVENALKTLSDHRKLALYYVHLGDTFCVQEDYESAQRTFRNAILALNKIEENDRIEKDWRNLGAFQVVLGSIFFKQEDYENAKIAFNNAILAFNKIEESARTKDTLEKLLELHSFLGQSFVKQRNYKKAETKYQHAIMAWSTFTFNEPYEKDQSCDWNSLARIYNLWNCLYLPNGIAYALTLFGMNSFDNNIAIKKNEDDFYKIYSEISNPTNWQNSKDFINPLIQLMEIILRGYQSKNFPNPPLKHYLQSPGNLAVFKEKLQELRELSQSLEELVGTSPSTILAVVHKVGYLEHQNKELEKELGETKTALKDVLDELKALKSQFEEKSSSPSYYDGGQKGTFFAEKQTKRKRGIESTTNNRPLKNKRM